MLEDAVDDILWEVGFLSYAFVAGASGKGNGGPEVEVVQDVEAGCIGHYLELTCQSWYWAKEKRSYVRNEHS